MNVERLKSVFKMFDINNVNVEVTIFSSLTLTSLCTIIKDYLGLSIALMFALVSVVTADFITGVSASIKNKNKITSSRGLTSLYKFGVYMLFIYVTFSFYNEYKEVEGINILARYINIYVISHILFWELFSVDENLKKLGIDLKITNVLKNIYKKINKKMKWEE